MKTLTSSVIKEFFIETLKCNVMQAHHDHSTSVGTLTGTVFTVCAMIDMHDYIKTIVLALIGACVSFLVTLVLKRIMKRFEK